MREPWRCTRCSTFNEESNTCLSCGVTRPAEAERAAAPYTDIRGLMLGFAGVVGLGVAGLALSGLAAGRLLVFQRASPLDRCGVVTLGTILSLPALHSLWQACMQRKRQRRRGRPDFRDPASFSDYLRGEANPERDVPWALRDPEDARALLAAAAAEGMPQGRVERLALLHLLMRMHREAHARTGNPVNALGQAIAQQQFNALVDLCTYEELYAFFGGPSSAEGLSAERIDDLPLVTVAWVDGCASVGGVKVVDCSICLEGFQKGDRVRQLQQCSHVFHRGCVDRWLRMHSACPLCRTAL